MRLISVTHKNGKDVWAVVHSGEQEEGVFEFVSAFMNGVHMQETWKVEAVQEQQAGSKKKKLKFDKKQMQEDFNNHPTGPPVKVERIIRDKKWCLPLRGPGGVILYTCDGEGHVSCG